MSRQPRARVIAIIVAVGVVLIVVAGTTGAHVRGKSGSPHPWLSAAIAGAIYAAAAAVAVAVGSRDRRQR